MGARDDKGGTAGWEAMMSLVKLQDLTGRVALVTGGSRGLGIQMAEVLGELGTRVAITARMALGSKRRNRRTSSSLPVDRRDFQEGVGPPQLAASLICAAVISSVPMVEPHFRDRRSATL